MTSAESVDTIGEEPPGEGRRTDVPEKPEPPDGPNHDGTSPLARIAWMGTPLSIYLATRILQFWVLEWMLPPGSLMRDKLLAWDASWFVRVAQDGYPTSYEYGPNGELLGSTLAFFPGYPMVIRAVAAVTGLDHGTAAIALAWTFGGIVAVLLCALATRLWNRRVALALVALVCVQPMSVVFTMAYSEPMFLALVLASFLAVHKDWWLLGGFFGFLAGLTRPTGAALALALIVAAVLHVRNRSVGRRRFVALGGALLACLGVPSYLWWVGDRVGDRSAWFKVQSAGWGTRTDYGVMVFRFVRDAFRAGDGWVQMSVALILVSAVFLALLSIYMMFRREIWPPLVVYGLVAVGLVVGQAGYYHSKPRLLVPVLLTLVPPAIALGRARPRTAVAVLVAFGLFGLWYGAHMIMVWRYAI
jgi:4-amino-4-deoxy-L-arabinose transferase-like glycosyltransferase